MSGNNVIMEVHGVSKSFGPTVALSDVDITVHGGEIRGLIGENGSGKSTVTSIYAGMQAADSGEMFFMGEPWQPASMVDAMNRGVGMIVQETGTIADITVAENMFLGEADRFCTFETKAGKKWGPVNARALNRAAQEALDEIGASHIRAEQITGSLDMQERKLVEIAKVWMKHPTLIVVDETTTALSQRGREIIYDLINRMRDAGKAVVFISHDLDEIMEKCNALTVLRDGKIIRTFAKEQFDADAIRTSMIGRELQGSYYRDDTNNSYSDKVALELVNVSFRDRAIDVSLQAHRGEILGIGGLSHCGMHTLGKILYGAIKPESGEVLVHTENEAGEETAEPVKNERFAMQCGIGYVAKDRDTESLNMTTTIRDNVAIAGLDKFEVAGFLTLASREREYVEKNIGALSTKYFSIDQPVSDLSGGNKQKVVFAKWIGAGSDILILDCPTRGVDIGVKQAMYQLMYRMKEEGKTILMISEEMAELMGMCDRLLIMKDGQIKKEFLRADGYDDNEIIKYMI
jgi:ribose transport system ATP-binding protein